VVVRGIIKSLSLKVRGGEKRGGGVISVMQLLVVERIDATQCVVRAHAW